MTGFSSKARAAVVVIDGSKPMHNIQYFAAALDCHLRRVEWI